MSKERLTERFSNGQAAVKGCGTNCNYGYEYCVNHVEDCPTITEIYDKLAEYEDLEEQGLLLRLPISVGSPILDNGFEIPYIYEVTGFSYGDINEDDYDSDEELPTDELIIHYRNYIGSITGKFPIESIRGKFPISEIGKTVFLTQSEAEEKLRELEGK